MVVGIRRNLVTCLADNILTELRGRRYNVCGRTTNSIDKVLGNRLGHVLGNVLGNRISNVLGNRISNNVVDNRGRTRGIVGSRVATRYKARKGRLSSSVGNSNLTICSSTVGHSLSNINLGQQQPNGVGQQAKVRLSRGDNDAFHAVTILARFGGAR